MPWVDPLWEGGFDRLHWRVTLAAATIAEFDRIMDGKSDVEVKIPLFDPLLQELNGMMDLLVFPARRPVPGELPTWNLETGLDTTQPRRSKRKVDTRKGVGSQSSQRDSHASLASPFRTSWFGSLAGIPEVARRELARAKTDEKANVLPSDAVLGARVPKEAEVFLVLDPANEVSLCINNTAEEIEQPPHLYVTKADHPITTCEPKSLKDDQATNRCSYQKPNPPSVGGYDPESATTPHYAGTTHLVQPMDAIGVDSALPSLTFDTSTFQDTLLPAEVPMPARQPEDIWFAPDMGFGLGQDHAAEASESQANLAMAGNSQPVLSMRSTSETVGKSGSLGWNDFYTGPV